MMRLSYDQKEMLKQVAIVTAASVLSAILLKKFRLVK